MGQKLHERLDVWKKLLLDFGKRNRLINFKENKRSNVRIISPSCDSLFSLIAIQEKVIEFPYAIEHVVDSYAEEDENLYEIISEGDVETSKRPKDLQRTLKHLRYKANTSIEEQGINILYLAFGLLRHYKIFCVNGNTGFKLEPRIFYFIHLQNEEVYERKESSSAR